MNPFRPSCRYEAEAHGWDSWHQMCIRDRPVSNRRLYVGNLSYEATESDLEDVFKGSGEVNSVEIIYNPRTHKSKGYAFVEMKKMEDAIQMCIRDSRYSLRTERNGKNGLSSL